MRWSHFGRGQVILMRFFIIFMKKKPRFYANFISTTSDGDIPVEDKWQFNTPFAV
jgi:predicted SnoaL-like aldol condensation-catalyzing enzyme